MTRHQWRLDPAQVQRHIDRRGRPHAYECVDPAQTAFVVVDMVPFFVAANPYCEAIIPTVVELAAACRGAAGLVAWVVPASAPLPPGRREFFGAEVADRYESSGGSGAIEGRVERRLVPQSRDLFVEKRTPSAFFPGGSLLHDDLTTRGVDTIVVAGTVANVCVESTVRDAATLGYRVIVAADAVAAISTTI